VFRAIILTDHLRGAANKRLHPAATATFMRIVSMKTELGTATSPGDQSLRQGSVEQHENAAGGFTQ
jgi:hypothetical protein